MVNYSLRNVLSFVFLHQRGNILKLSLFLIIIVIEFFNELLVDETEMLGAFYNLIQTLLNNLHILDNHYLHLFDNSIEDALFVIV